MGDSTDFPLTVVAYRAKLDYEKWLSKGMVFCNNCEALAADVQLKRCTGCQLAAYCSKRCQKQHWPRHKRWCNLVQGKGKKNAYLSGLDIEEVYNVVIDSYRLRKHLDRRFWEDGTHYDGTLTDALVGPNGDVYADFQWYLDLAETSGILPEHWNFEDRMQCLASAVDDANDYSIFRKPNHDQLLKRYGHDPTLRRTMDILAELVVGYEGTGPAKDNEWYFNHIKTIKIDPEKQDALLSDLTNRLNASLEARGKSPYTPH